MGKSYQYRQKSRYRQRAVDTLEIRQRFLIVCEGEKTEPYYFNKFRTPKTVINIKIENCDAVSLIKQAIDYNNRDNYDRVWCVFDKDDKPSENFYTAIELANQNKICVAYSNEAFELWYFLHYDYLDTGISRGEYIKKLDKYLGRKYKKNDENMYEILFPYQSDAIRNAKKLLAQYDPLRPADDNPSTTIHLLVEELNRFNFDI